MFVNKRNFSSGALEIKMRVIRKDTGGDFLHEVAHNTENTYAGGNDDKHDDEIICSEEDKFEEIANQRDGEGGCHDADNGNKKASTKLVKRARNPVNKDEIDSEGNENRDSGKLWMREALEVRYDGERSHTE